MTVRNQQIKSKRGECPHDCCLGRLTELPGVILHHIFSFLDENDMFPTLAVSKRCAELCLSSPYIYFASGKRKGIYFRNFVDRYIADHQKNPINNYYYIGCDKSRCKSFKYFLDKYRSKHGKNEVHSFHLQWFQDECPCYADGKSLIDAWLCHLAEGNIRELSLDIDLRGETKNLLNLTVGYKLLRVLEIDVHCDMIKLPLTVFSCLEILSLNCSNFDSSSCSVGEWISNYCPALKKLSLVSLPDELELVNDSFTDVTIVTDSFYFVTISGKNLQLLSIFFPTHAIDYSVLELEEEEKTHVEISAPNLAVLNWEGCLPERLSFSKPLRLTEATLNTSRTMKPGESTLKPFVQLLACVGSVKVLRLHFSMVEAMFIIRLFRPIHFENLHQLEIMKCTSDTETGFPIPLIAYFVKGTPKLRFLAIDCKENDDHWKWSMVQELLCPIISWKELYQDKAHIPQVKKLEMRLSDDSRKTSNGSLLVKYFLETVIDLEMMTILCPPPFFNELSALLADVKSASSRVKVVTIVEP